MSQPTMMNKEIQKRFLENSSPNIVYDWLEKNAPELRAWSFIDEKPEIEFALLERNEPIIDLALALFSHNIETRDTLFNREDKILQKAVLSNKNCGHFTALKSLLKDVNTEYLEILLTNTEDRLFLVDLYKKQRIFRNLKRTFWIDLLALTLRNKILQYAYCSDDDKRDDIGTAVYRLFNTLTASDENANLLAQLVNQLPKVQNHFAIEEPLKLIRKWQNKKKVKHSDYIYFQEHRQWNDGDDKYEKIENSCWIEEDYINCRTHLANFFNWSSTEFKNFKDSEDIALRLAFYRNFYFQYEEETTAFLENWEKYREKDGDLFNENIIKNISLYYNKTIREYIGDGFPLINAFYADEYQKKLKEVQKLYPEKFIDNSQIEKIESIKSEFSTIRNDINSTAQENLNIKKLISNQRTTSFLILFLLVVLILILWL